MGGSTVSASNTWISDIMIEGGLGCEHFDIEKEVASHPAYLYRFTFGNAVLLFRRCQPVSSRSLHCDSCQSPNSLGTWPFTSLFGGASQSTILGWQWVDEAWNYSSHICTYMFLPSLWLSIQWEDSVLYANSFQDSWSLFKCSFFVVYGFGSYECYGRNRRPQAASKQCQSSVKPAKWINKRQVYSTSTSTTLDRKSVV